MTSQIPKIIFFDWDNTLVDSWQVIGASLNDTLSAFGQEKWSVDKIKGNVRYSLRDSFPRLFGDEWEKARDHYYAYYKSYHLDMVTPYDGTVELLEYLNHHNIICCIISNKASHLLHLELAHLDLSHRFAIANGAGDYDYDKPNPMPIYQQCAQLGFDKGDLESCWYVGDMPTDMEIAHKTNCVATYMSPAEKKDNFDDWQHKPQLKFNNPQEMRLFIAKMDKKD